MVKEGGISSWFNDYVSDTIPGVLVSLPKPKESELGCKPSHRALSFGDFTETKIQVMIYCWLVRVSLLITTGARSFLGKGT